MHISGPTIATVAFTLIGAVLSAPVLVKGFKKRGTGIKYEENFAIQRAPQLATFINVLLIVTAFLTYSDVPGAAQFAPVAALTSQKPEGLIAVLSWFGVAQLISGEIFMIGGWYSLGECFTTDAELLEGHTVRNTGLLSYVMHPAYSGIIQSLLGASLAATSIFSALFTIFIVAPLWLNRAKYEEKILLENLGQSYKEYAETMKWRRLVPRFFPIGV